MLELNKQQFDEKHKKKEIHVFCFYKPECKVCDDYFLKLNEYPISSVFNKININDDIVYFKTQLGIWIIPETRLYYDSKILWTCSGILYTKQIKKIINILNSKGE